MHAIIAIGIIIAILVAIVVIVWIVEEFGEFILMLMLFVGFAGIAIGGTFLLIHSIMIDDVVGGVLGFVGASIGWLIVGAIVFSWFK
jgi:hypothetical protein